MSPQGWCYVLSHPLWDRIGATGAVKIGHTKTDPAARGIRIASASGLLVKPKVEFCLLVDDSAAVERAVHQKLDRYRVSSRREMFAVSIAEARVVIEKSCETRSVTMCRRTGYRRWRSPRRRKRLHLGSALLVASTLLGLALAFR